MRNKKGYLIVFEGADGVGKSTLSKAFADCLTGNKYDSKIFSFPGMDENTLGGWVYKYHHNAKESGYKPTNSTSLQLLHIAAHLDAINNCIIPNINAGKIVILDRFWWSTYVYGKVFGVSEEDLGAMISIEHRFWGSYTPLVIFLIDREEPFKEEYKDVWKDIHNEYINLADIEKTRSTVKIVVNDGDIISGVSTLYDLFRSFHFAESCS